MDVITCAEQSFFYSASVMSCSLLFCIGEQDASCSFWTLPFFKKNIFYWLCYYSCPIPPLRLSSCPWVIHISSLASTFPILFLTSPCLFCTYYLCFLFPLSFPLFSPLSLPTDNPPCDLHFCDSVPVLVVCLVCFCFLRFNCW